MTYSPYPQATAPPQIQLLATVEHCAAHCERMITVLLHYPDLASRAPQIQLLRDCASICDATACFLARASGASKMLASVCASICEACGRECARFQDHESQHCSRICQHCAQECRPFAR